jgi:hypothetical protein
MGGSPLFHQKPLEVVEAADACEFSQVGGGGAGGVGVGVWEGFSMPSYICILILLYMCVLILLYVCPHTTMCLHTPMCPHTATYSSSYY